MAAVDVLHILGRPRGDVTWAIYSSHVRKAVDVGCCDIPEMSLLPAAHIPLGIVRHLHYKTKVEALTVLESSHFSWDMPHSTSSRCLYEGNYLVVLRA